LIEDKEDLLNLDLYSTEPNNVLESTSYEAPIGEEDIDFAAALGLEDMGDDDGAKPLGVKMAKETFPPAATIVIERKSLADLKSSYSDGRYKDQKARLINCGASVVMMLGKGHFLVPSGLLAPLGPSLPERGEQVNPLANAPPFYS
jgi:hypothetical protein